MHKSTETDVNALAVIPWRFPAWSTVIPITRWQSSPSPCGSLIGW